MPKLGPLADSLKTDADNIQNVITNLDGLAKGADSVLGTADKFISTTDKQLQEQLKQLHVTLLNLKVVTTYAKELVETLAEKPNRIIFSGKPATLTPESEILKSSKPLPAQKTVVVAASLCDALSQQLRKVESRRNERVSAVFRLYFDDVGMSGSYRCRCKRVTGNNRTYLRLVR